MAVMIHEFEVDVQPESQATVQRQPRPLRCPHRTWGRKRSNACAPPDGTLRARVGALG